LPKKINLNRSDQIYGKRGKHGSSANGVVFLAGGGGLDVLRDERQGVFLSGAGAFGALAG
jgi:hypothetical protein